MSVDTGGAAFPLPGNSDPGMTLRDYFAALCRDDARLMHENMPTNAIEDILGIKRDSYRWLDHLPLAIGALSYRLADGMIAAKRRSDLAPA